MSDPGFTVRGKTGLQVREVEKRSGGWTVVSAMAVKLGLKAEGGQAAGVGPEEPQTLLPAHSLLSGLPEKHRAGRGRPLLAKGALHTVLPARAPGMLTSLCEPSPCTPACGLPSQLGLKVTARAQGAGLWGFETPHHDLLQLLLIPRHQRSTNQLACATSHGHDLVTHHRDPLLTHQTPGTRAHANYTASSSANHSSW